MADTAPSTPRARGHIRRRGTSLQVLVFTGIDPVTGKNSYLTESVTIGTGPDGERTARRQAEKIRTRMLAGRDRSAVARTTTNLERAIEEWFAVAELETSTRLGYRSYIDRYIVPALGSTPVKNLKVQSLDQFYAGLRRCRTGCSGRSQVEHRLDGPHECREVIHRRKRVHDCAAVRCRVLECAPHECKPLGAATVRQIHSIISAALGNAVRWEWIPDNPALLARKPAQPRPQPKPPSAAEAARIVSAAFARDEGWGTLVWLTMVTGMRRGELVALRWSDIDLAGAVVDVSKAYFTRQGMKVEKDTKTHQMRSPAIDAATVEVLRRHKVRCAEQLLAVGAGRIDATYVFSPKPDRSRPYYPDAVTRRYSRMVTGLGIETHLHALRHYNATELLRNGVDLTTVAGRLGHGGGGTTTLRVYAAFVPESDRRAASVIADQMPVILTNEEAAGGDHK
jgi:integrase